jgi:hypothetical protein
MTPTSAMAASTRNAVVMPYTKASRAGSSLPAPRPSADASEESLSWAARVKTVVVSARPTDPPATWNM